MDPISLRNRLLVAASTWREGVGEPLPKMPQGEPEAQVEAFELTLVQRLWDGATNDNAAEVADRTWSLVHDRPDDDPVKQRVVACHQALTAMRRGG